MRQPLVPALVVVLAVAAFALGRAVAASAALTAVGAYLVGVHDASTRASRLGLALLAAGAVLALVSGKLGPT